MSKVALDDRRLRLCIAGLTMGVAAFASGCGGGDSDSPPPLVAKSPIPRALEPALSPIATDCVFS